MSVVRQRIGPEPVAEKGMADEINPRAFRSHDPARDRSSPGAQQDSDPLAELARLIGQTSGDFGRSGGPQSVGRVAPQSMPPAGAHGADTFRRDYGGYEQSEHAGSPAGHPAQGDTYASGSQSVGPYAPAPEQQYGYSDPARVAGRMMGGEARGDDHYGHDAYQSAEAYDDHRLDSEYAGYEEAPYASQHGEETDYDAESYYDEGQESEEDYYEDEAPPRRRGRLMTVLGVVVLAITGTAGAYGYRHVFSTARQAPPVIKAEAGPNKVMPENQSEGQSGKQIYDRLGDAGKGEKVVSREEQPVEVATPGQPRIVFPRLVANSEPATTSGPAEQLPTSAAPFPPQAPTAVSGTAPKKIHTVVIHPDGADPFAHANPPPVKTAAAAPPPTRSATASSNAPLALVPRAAATSGTAHPATTASIAPAPSRPSASHHAVAAGGFNVQLLAQKTKEEAETSFRALQAKYPKILGGRDPIIRRKDLGDKGVFFGAQIGPFASRTEANELCSNLKAQGGSCLVQKN